MLLIVVILDLWNLLDFVLASTTTTTLLQSQDSWDWIYESSIPCNFICCCFVGAMRVYRVEKGLITKESFGVRYTI